MSSTAPVPFLQMQGIVKRFAGVTALKGVGFDVSAGEVHMLLGENGAGKSTLIKVLSGVHVPDEGRMLIEGVPATIRNPRDAQGYGLSTIYQEFNLAPDLTVAENIFLGREPLRGGFPGLVNYPLLKARSRQLLEDLGLAIDPDGLVSRLGVAQQQMVEIAKALSINSRLIVMDEPTAVLTSQEIDTLFRVVRTLKERGVAIIYISHRLDEVRALGDRATVLRDGALIGTVDVAGTTTDQLIRMMVGRDLHDKFPKAEVAPGEEVLRVSGLGRKGVLSDVSFTLRRGEIVGLAGLIGSGRTEVARCIFGADPIDSGSIALRGEPIRIRNPRHAIDSGVALVPEDRKQQGILASMSIRENITIATLAGYDTLGVLNVAREEAHAWKFCKTLNLKTPTLDRPIVQLSGGNQQKAIIARWLSANAAVYIFDEPTRGIDVGAKVEIYQLMGELVKRGAAILMISSELPEILGMSDRILVMRGGTICAQLGRADATEEAILGCALGDIPTEYLHAGALQ